MESLEIFLLGASAGATLALAGVAWLVANRSWRRATFSGVRLSFGELMGMRLRGTPPALIADATIALAKRSRPATLQQVEATYIGYGRPTMDAVELADLVEGALSSATSPAAEGQA
jgi:uncharacterized protein YqfA (UPF0365 family)